MTKYLESLKNSLNGDLFYDLSTRIQYTTDASVYKETPLAVAYPQNEADIIKIIRFANEKQITLVPRGAGTSLAGQATGNGLIVDISRHFREIKTINIEEQYAIVEPGVIRDELNLILAHDNLFFAPETSTSNRCCIGGMAGNNSCGANSLLYGNTRDHIISMKAILSDGSKVVFEELSEKQFYDKCQLSSLEGEIYRHLFKLLSPQETQDEIRKEFPDKSIRRRSMGYAIDELIEMLPFTNEGRAINLSSLIVGSEGTLAFITEITVRLTPIPPDRKALLIVESPSIEEALEANITALPYHPSSIEMIDNLILELAQQNPLQKKNSSFVKGSPGAILIIDVEGESITTVREKLTIIKNAISIKHPLLTFSFIEGDEMAKVWNLRKAGLGVLSNVRGDTKPVTVVEDVAILPEKYPAYYQEFKKMLSQFNLRCAFYGHISTGELHNKPLINLKDTEETKLFRVLAMQNAMLVKKWGGCLSGEHGDGRLRGEFLPIMVGENNYQLFKKIKHLFDPESIFNAGKIVDTPPMNNNLRYAPNPIIGIAKMKRKNSIDRYSLKTIFDFSDTDGILRAIENCNGSADCRRSHLFRGTMCPSFQATLDEKQSTRARANLLREFLSNSSKSNPFDHPELLEILDLCLACKACKIECPSNVDMTKLKTEFLSQYYRQHLMPFRSWLIAWYPLINHVGMSLSSVYNFFCVNPFLSNIIKWIVGFSPQRSLPLLSPTSLKKWHQNKGKKIEKPIKKVYFFNDEFTNTLDVNIGKKAVKLLEQLNYQVIFIDHHFSGRTFLSKGKLKKARELAEKNVKLFAELITDETPLIGIEPSAILSFRDEYTEIVSPELRENARKIAPYCLLIDEFIASEYEKGNIRKEQFTSQKAEIIFHSHCYQKALSDSKATVKMMEIPMHYQVKEIKSGCCGMAGGFGCEKKHYDLSMKIGELILFPTIRNRAKDVIITATGTSCRHQIKDGTGERSYHPVEVLYESLKR